MKSIDITLKAISTKLNQIQNRNPNYLDNKQWRKLKQLENELYRKKQEEMEL